MARAQLLNQYFLDEHDFEPENYIDGIILYKRINAQGVLERIVVKHQPLPPWGLPDDEAIDIEENFLQRLWGSEHTIRLLSVVDDRRHRAPVKWAPPINRPLLNPILPWKLPMDPAIYPNTNFQFFVMEYLSRGDGRGLIRRCRHMGITEISEPLLWTFWLCLTRGCIGMAFPPNRGNLNPPAVMREVLPPPAQRGSRIAHNDLHLGNFMFGEYEPQGGQPDCHIITPTLKIIDFGIADQLQGPVEAQRMNMKAVGELMHNVALIEEYMLDADQFSPRYRIRNVPGMNDFETWATGQLFNSGHLSDDFKLLIARCLAVDPRNRPTIRPVLDECERNIGMTPNWQNLRDETYELFDAVPLQFSGSDSGSEYTP